MMKKNEWLEKVSLTDEKFIEEADPTAIKLVRRKKRRIIFPLVAAVALVLAVTMSMPVLLPLLGEKDPQHTDPTTPNDYQELYGLLKGIDYTDFELGGSDSEGWVEEGVDTDVIPEEPVGGDNVSYQETTDNQIAGVIEPDILKRSDRYLYYLANQYDENNAHLLIYSIDGERSEKVGSFQIGDADMYARSFFLSEDCKTVTLIGRAGSNTSVVAQVDVSEPADAVLKSRLVFSFGDTSARMVNGKILLLGTQYVSEDDLKVPEEKNYLPYIIYHTETAENGDHTPVKEYFAPGEILCPKEPQARAYQITVVLNAENLSVEGKKALLAYGAEAHINKENIYFMRPFRETVELEPNADDAVRSHMQTEIIGIHYGDGSLALNGSVTVEGIVKDRYCLDEYNGILRVATTARVTTADWKNSFSPMLHCIALDSYEIVVTVKDFAPEGEEVTAVRFDGTNAYICTAVVVNFTDPVFFFDLSDLSNIKYTDTGVISGYSDDLSKFGEGFLLGIGKGESRASLKIEMYKEEDGKVVSVDKYASAENEEVFISDDYNDYYIDRENGLIGLGMIATAYEWNEEEQRDVAISKDGYLLLHFDGEEFTAQIFKFQSVMSCNMMRAVYVDGYLYLLGNVEFIVQAFEL